MRNSFCAPRSMELDFYFSVEEDPPLNGRGTRQKMSFFLCTSCHRGYNTAVCPRRPLARLYFVGGSRGGLPGGQRLADPLERGTESSGIEHQCCAYKLGEKNPPFFRPLDGYSTPLCVFVSSSYQPPNTTPQPFSVTTTFFFVFGHVDLRKFVCACFFFRNPSLLWTRGVVGQLFLWDRFPANATCVT